MDVQIQNLGEMEDKPTSEKLVVLHPYVTTRLRVDYNIYKGLRRPVSADQKVRQQCGRRIAILAAETEAR